MFPTAIAPMPVYLRFGGLLVDELVCPIATRTTAIYIERRFKLTHDK